MKDSITIGMDLGDKYHTAVVFDEKGNEQDVFKVVNTQTGIKKVFKEYQGATVAIEAGTHSPWISRLLNDLGLTVFIGNPRKLRFIWSSKDKSDERDARMLGMVCRLDPRLLSPLQHRNRQAQADLTMIKSRDMLVQTRTKLINHARGIVKAYGERLPKCSADSFAKRCKKEIPPDLIPALEPIFQAIIQLTGQIYEIDDKIDQLSLEKYPETKRLRQVPGVGPITALAYVLTIEDPARFSKSRQIRPFLGLTPRRDQSGASDKQLCITKAGNKYLRQLLVSCSQYILGPFGPECNLRRCGMAICSRGGRNAKKRAVVAIARKLGVLLYRLWVNQEVYDPFYGVQKAA